MALDTAIVAGQFLPEGDATSTIDAPSQSEGVRRGPPNRMNDLVYRDWMKFQKSFFRHNSLTQVVQECVAFFTKAVWPEGHASRSLIIGFGLDDADIAPPPRQIDVCNPHSLSDMLTCLKSARDDGHCYDFAFVNLAPYLRTADEVTDFLTHWAEEYFSLLRAVVQHNRYCGMIVDVLGSGGKGFPAPWSVALAGRNHLRLKDEKVGLIEAEDRIYYCLFFQSLDDARPASSFSPASIHMTNADPSIAPWVMPKSPPRKKDEIYHPAKFPESLIERFICDFSQPGDTVLDPMVGTGSAVIAAVKLHRNAIGVDLSDEFARIARRRLAEANPPTLFEEFEPSAQGTIIQGDATRLTSLPELQDYTFNYCVTSPPYWSMLSNPGSENQRARRERNLPLVYSDHSHDVGNIQDYEAFIDTLVSAYSQVAARLVTGGYLTVVVKNVKRDHVLYPLAWDLTARLCGDDGLYDYAGTTLWCQDDVGLKPFAVGIYWVSNILHQYCLHFQVRGR